MDDVIFVFGTELLGDANERRTSGFWDAIVNYDDVIVSVIVNVAMNAVMKIVTHSVVTDVTD